MKQPGEMKCTRCQLATDSGIREAVSAVISAPDSLITRKLIEFLFSVLLQRTPEGTLTKPVLKAVFEKLTCTAPNTINSSEERAELSWTDIWRDWAIALSKWEHKLDLFNLLASIKIKFEHSCFLFALQLLAISECHRALHPDPIDSEDLEATEAATAKSYDVQNLPHCDDQSDTGW